MESGYLSLFVEETSIIEARNLTRIEVEEKRYSPALPQKNIEIPSKTVISSIQNYPSEYTSPKLPLETSSISGFNPIETTLEEKQVNSENFQPIEQFSNSYSPVANDDLISTLSPNHLTSNNLSSDGTSNVSKTSSLASSKMSPVNEKNEGGGNALFDKLKNWLPVKSTSNQENQKQITKAKMGKPNSFRYDEKLKKWIDDNDPSTSQEAPKLPPPPIAVERSSPAGQSAPNLNIAPNFRAKKGKVKYFDPLNPEGPSSSQLQPSVPNFDQ